MASPSEDDNLPDSDSSSSSEDDDLIPTNPMFGVDKPLHTSETYVYGKTPKVKPNKDDLQSDLDPNLSDVEKDLEMKGSMEQGQMPHPPTFYGVPNQSYFGWQGQPTEGLNPYHQFYPRTQPNQTIEPVERPKFKNTGREKKSSPSGPKNILRGQMPHPPPLYGAPNQPYFGWQGQPTEGVNPYHQCYPRAQPNQTTEPVERPKLFKTTEREIKSSHSGSTNMLKSTNKSGKGKPLMQKAAEDKGSNVIMRDNKPQTSEDLDETEFYVLVKGLASRNESDAYFENLVEVKSGKDVKPDSLIFDVERACCMCVLIGKPDMTTFRNKMAAVKGFKMTVHELPAPSCVVVSTDWELTSYSPLLYYLENKGSANTLDDQAEFTEDGNCYIVRFETSEAVKKLMQHPHHEVNKIPLRMSPYFTCSEGHIYDYNLHSVPTPADVTVKQSSHLMEFLQRPCCAALTTQMETCHTTVSFKEDGVVLHCTLTSLVKNCRLLVKTWEAKSRNQLDQYIQETIEQKTISVPEKIWEKFEQLINSGENMADLEMMIKTKSEFQEVKVVGLKADVEKTIVYMEKTIQSLDRKIRRTTERKSKLDFCKLNLLKRTGFFNNLENSFEDLKVSIEDDDTVELEGVHEDITKGFLDIYIRMAKIEEKQQEHKFSQHHVAFIRKDAVRKYINEKLQGVDARVEWKVKDDNIIICSPPEETIQDHLWDLIEKSVLETRINLGSDKAVDLFETEEWFSTLEQKITRRFLPKFETVPPNMTDRYILIVSTDDVHQNLLKIVKRFLTDNLVIDELLPFDALSLAYTKRFLTDKVEQIVKDLEEHKVAVKYDSRTKGVNVFGTEKGLRLVRERLTDLMKQITCEAKTFQNVGLEHVPSEEFNCGSIQRIEEETRCIVKLPRNLEIALGWSSVDPHQYPWTQGHSRCTFGATRLQRQESMSSNEFITTKNDIRDDRVKGQINQGGLRDRVVKNKGRISPIQVLIYSDTEKNIRDCVRKMDALLNEKYSTARIDHDIAVVKALTKEQLSEIKKMFVVDIKIDQAAEMITIRGPTIAVDDATTEIHRKLRLIDRHMQHKEEEELLFQQIRWNFEEVTVTGFVHTEYEKSVNLIIERAYKNNDSTAQFVDQYGNNIKIDFSKMEETTQDVRVPPLKVFRKDIHVLITKTGISLPEQWDPMKDSENIKMVLLKPTDPEYQQLEKDFMAQVKNGGYTARTQFDVCKMKIDKIERVQNKHLWQQYVVRKAKIEKEKPTLPADMKPLERRVWHGTAATALTSIETYGFNRSYCGVNGTWFGEGVYFASDASYSSRGWLSGAQNTGPKRGYVFSVRAVTGHYTRGNPKMRFLPPIDPAKPLILFDSAVDKLQNPVEFLIFHDIQAYPEYLITFSAY